MLAEDQRTLRFFRLLLRELGFELRSFRFLVAPRGVGAAEAWVRLRYPGEVKALRSRNYQRRLCVVAVRDGDAVGVAARKREMDRELQAAGLDPRGPDERIALPVPTWSIESWLLSILGKSVAEDQRVKHEFSPPDETEALREAARAWAGFATPLPSLVDSRAEMQRVE